MPEPKTNQNLKEDIPPIYGQEWQDRVAEEAKRIGYVHLDNLKIILAVDVQYISYLPRLYMDFKGTKSFGDSPDFSTFGRRLEFWSFFLPALAPSTSELPWYKHHGGSPIPFPPLYLFNKQTKEYEKIAGMDRVKAGCDAFVNLEDLKRFLENLQLPLPSLIFAGSLNEADEKSRSGSLDRDGDATGLKQPYVFARTPPAWKIIFNGKELGGLKGKGFSFFHYLMKKQREKDTKPIDVVELFRQVGRGAIDNQISADNYPIADKRALKEYKETLDHLEREMNEAEKGNDFERLEKFRKEKEDLLAEVKKMTQLKGKSRKIPNDKAKIQESVRGSMRRALDKLKEDSPEAYKHFAESFKPINSTTHSYRPTIKLPWILK